MNKYTAIVSFLANIPESVRGCDEVLAYIYNNDRQGITTKITDVVYQRRFGTGPTVHSKLGQLEQKKLIKITRSKGDGRAKDIQITDKGISYLRGQDQEIGEMLGALA